MTQDYKDLLLDYLTGNLTNTYSDSTPYYKQDSYKTASTSDTTAIIGDTILECTDGNGVPNGKLIVYLEDSNKLILVDENLNVLKVYEEWYTGTLFEEFLALGIDEEGQFYGIDYNYITGKHRFLLMNNLSEPTKMPDGSYEYRAVLRQSYFINNYTVEDGIGTGYPTYLGKSKQSGIYYFALTNNIGEILPTKLTINVGAANEWERLPGLESLLGDQVLDSLIYFDNNDEPVAHYFVQDGVTKDIKRYDCYGDNAITNTILIEWSDVLNTFSTPEAIICKLRAITKDHYYFILDLYHTNGSSETYQTTIVSKDGYSSLSKSLWWKTTTAGYTNRRMPISFPIVTKNNDLSMFYRYMNSSDNTKDGLSYVFIPEDTPNWSKNANPHKWEIDTTTILNANYDYISFLFNTYNLYNAIYYSTESGTITQSIVTFTFNKDNENVSAYETKDGTGNKTLLPHQGLVFDENDKLIFARNLYNLKAFSNKNYSILNIPNNMLNDSTINKNKLISYTNQDIVENDEAITKNIYEDLYINYFNSITMQNRNTNNYITNQEGATRLNLSTSKELDYENAKIGKMQINYSDGTSLKGGISGTLTNGVMTYEMMFYYPNDKTITTIDILSEDEKTIYQTIEMPTLTANKTYRLRQDVHVE